MGNSSSESSDRFCKGPCWWKLNDDFKKAFNELVIAIGSPPNLKLDVHNAYNDRVVSYLEDGRDAQVWATFVYDKVKSWLQTNKQLHKKIYENIVKVHDRAKAMLSKRDYDARKWNDKEPNLRLFAEALVSDLTPLKNAIELLYIPSLRSRRP